MSDWTPRKELPQDPFNNFNLEQEWHHLHNYIPWEFGFPAREKLCWTDPCLTVGEVNLLRSLPFFSNHVWGEGGEPPGFAIAGPYKNPYKQEPRKPSSDPTPKDTPETSRAHQKTSNPGKLVTVTDSEAVPRHMVDAFLRKNSALFSQLATKPTPTATELKLNKLLLQIRHRTFLMSYNWKEGWLEGAMDPWGPIPGDTGEGHCMPWELVFKLIQDSVDALQVARNSGLSYPKRDFKGNVQKLTLPNYLLNQSPSGTTAPWIGFLVGNRREDPEAKIGRIQSGMGKETVKVAIAIQVNTPRKSEWSMEKLATYWEGVADLVQWRKTNHDLLMGECDTHGGNKQWLSSSQSMLKLIHDFVAGDSRCGWLRWEFFGPHKPEWDSLCKWARENYNANFDLNSKVPSWKRPARAVESNHE